MLNKSMLDKPVTRDEIDALGVDHGSLSGREDDDHTQYIKDAEFTADGEILVGTGVGTFQKESGATLRTSIDVYSTAEVTSEAIKWALVFGG